MKRHDPIVWALVLVASAVGRPASARLIVHPAPGGEVVASPDYQVTLRTPGQTSAPFVYYSWNQLGTNGPITMVSTSRCRFFGLHSETHRPPEANLDTYAHSWVAFDFDGGQVTVEVKLLRQPVGITLPLRSAAVLPSVHGLAARVSGDTITFTLAKPAKVAVVPNAAEAFAQLAGLEAKHALEGFRNPLFIFARAPERNIPNKAAPGTLVVQPGQSITAAQLAACQLVWFEPGVHDYARFNADDPDHYLELKKGQTAYLAGGAYLYGHFRSGVVRPVGDMPTVRGRGTLSGIKNRWSGIPWKHTPVKNLRVEGIQIADRHNHLTGAPGPLFDVAAPGAWHGNCDGPAIMLPANDPWDDWISDDCFIMAADTNLLIGGKAKVRNYTVWQLGNAEPLWIRGAVDGGLVDGLHIIAFNDCATGRPSNCMVTGKDAFAEPDRPQPHRRRAVFPMLFRMSTDFKGQARPSVRWCSRTSPSRRPAYRHRSRRLGGPGRPPRWEGSVPQTWTIVGRKVSKPTAANGSICSRPAARPGGGGFE